MIEVLDASDATRDTYLTFLADLCEVRVQHLLGRDFWDMDTIKEVCVLFSTVVKSFIKAPCTEEMGHMEENMRTGMVVYDILAMIKEKHRIFDGSDVIIIGDGRYIVSPEDNHLLIGDGPKSGMTLSTLTAMAGGFTREAQNRDFVFLAIMNFIGGHEGPSEFGAAP